MKESDRSLATVAILVLLTLPVHSGCDTGRGGLRAEGPRDLRPAVSDRPLQDRRATGDDGAPRDPEQRYRDAIVREVVDNPEIARLIPREPMLGGKWRVGSREDVEFLGSGKVALEYEDGHAAGRLIVKVKDPHDLSTWQVVRDEPD
jgi:hypothetical protein